MKLDENVTVVMVDSHPKYVRWRGRNYTITKIGLHHVYRTGRTLYHIFSVLTGTIFMRLKLNTDNLNWSLEEIADS